MRRLATLLSLVSLSLALCCTAGAQTSPGGGLVTPDWCRKLPRPEYSHLERIPVHDEWFEVYRVAPHVLAIYEPHQAKFAEPGQTRD
jgi:hypothetical protein